MGNRRIVKVTKEVPFGCTSGHLMWLLEQARKQAMRRAGEEGVLIPKQRVLILVEQEFEGG